MKIRLYTPWGVSTDGRMECVCLHEMHFTRVIVKQCVITACSSKETIILEYSEKSVHLPFALQLGHLRWNKSILFIDSLKISMSLFNLFFEKCLKNTAYPRIMMLYLMIHRGDDRFAYRRWSLLAFHYSLFKVFTISFHIK